MPRSPEYIELNIPNIHSLIMELPQYGFLSKTKNGFAYLNIHDDFIFKLFPFVREMDDNIQIPNYFDNESIGAHISVIYPEENTDISSDEIGKKHQFKIISTVSAILGATEYYVLLIQSETLAVLRKKYGLGKKLLFKNYLIDFHITVGKLSLLQKK